MVQILVLIVYGLKSKMQINKNLTIAISEKYDFYHEIGFGYCVKSIVLHEINSSLHFFLDSAIIFNYSLPNQLKTSMHSLMVRR